MQNLYTIVGTDRVLIDNKIKEIEELYKDKSYEKTNIDLDDNSIITLLNEINTIPFLEDFRMVILSNPNFLYDIKKIDERLVKSFEAFIQNPIETTILITIIKDEKSDLIHMLKNSSKVFVLDNLKDLALDEMITKMCLNDDFEIEKRAIDELVIRLNNDYNRVSVELEKLKIYKWDSKKILYDDVKLMVNKDLDDNIYDLVNAVLEKNKYKIMELYQDLMTLNEDESRIVASLVSKFNEMYQTKELTEEGLNKDEIASIFKVKPGRAYYMIKNAKMASKKDIRDNINKLVDIDYKIKSGQMDKNLALELYLLGI